MFFENYKKDKKGDFEMLSKINVCLGKIYKKDFNKDIKKIFMDIAYEKKTHLGEVETLILRFDKKQVEKLIGKIVICL